MAESLNIEPALTVEVEPGYWHRGHYHEGSKSWIDPSKTWALPIGTKLYSETQFLIKKQEADRLKGLLCELVEAYCRAGDPLTREERTEDRLRLAAAYAELGIP